MEFAAVRGEGGGGVGSEQLKVERQRARETECERRQLSEGYISVCNVRVMGSLFRGHGEVGR